MSGSKPKKKLAWWWQLLFGIIFTPIILPLALLALILFIISTVCLHILIWSLWCSRGRRILFVYSDSPVWHDYIERHVIPYLGPRAVVLNWSQRKRWKLSLARMAFYHFGGYREFNPLAVVFRPFRRTRTFRFWQAFRDYKHGHCEKLEQMERVFFGLIGVARDETKA